MRRAPRDEQKHRDVRVGELAEQALALGRGGGDDLRPLEMQGLGGAVEAMDRAAVESFEQGGVVRRDQVDELQIESFFVAVGL